MARTHTRSRKRKSVWQRWVICVGEQEERQHRWSKSGIEKEGGAGLNEELEGSLWGTKSEAKMMKDEKESGEREIGDVKERGGDGKLEQKGWHGEQNARKTRVVGGERCMLQLGCTRAGDRGVEEEERKRYMWLGAKDRRGGRWGGRRRVAYVSWRTIRGVHDTSPGVSTQRVPPNRS